MAALPHKNNGKWGSISYNTGTNHKYDLWVTSLEQPFTLNGSSSQSRLTKHFYPHGLGVGAVNVGCITASQQDYQALARFVRAHQLSMINVPAAENTFAPVPNNVPSRLMTLSVPTEGIRYRGFIDAFTITKRGVFDPAPRCQFSFTVITDPHTPNNYSLSHALVKWNESNLIVSTDELTPNLFNVNGFKNFWELVVEGNPAFRKHKT